MTARSNAVILGRLICRWTTSVIQNRAMASEPEVLSLAELARNLGISRERARQLENRAMNKLRRAVREAKCPALDDWIGNSVRAQAWSAPAA
jgi:DNA-directed RNA polymerase sigma subunit (sigma70/sigma32)